MKTFVLTCALVLTVFCIFLSPLSHAQWIQTTGPGTDAITSFIVRGPTAFAATEFGAVYCTSDDGDHWREVDSGLVGAYIWALTQHGTNLVAATDSGVFTSTDWGAIWTMRSRGLPRLSIHAIVSDSTNLFAACDSGVFVSKDGAATWHVADSGLTTLSVISLATIGGNVIAGTGTKGMFLSRDDASFWVPIDSIPITYASFDVHRLTAFGNSLYAAVRWMPKVVASYGGLFVSTDYGASWVKGFTTGSIEGGEMYVFDLASYGPISLKQQAGERS